MKLLYNEEGAPFDIVSLLSFINEFTKELGIKDVLIDDHLCEGILNGMRQDFPHVDGMEKASAFKKMANFMAYFIAEQPIKNPFPKDIIGAELANIPNHQSSMVAFALAVECLHNAKIHRSGGDVVLEKRIALSRHSYIDLMHSLSVITPRDHYQLLTVLLEQLAYKVNPDCQYKMFEM